MSATTITTAPRPAARRGRPVHDGLVLVRNNIRMMPRIPEVTIFMLFQPIMFVLLFSYVFGGAIKVPGVSYREYLMAGIFTQTVAFATASTSAGLATAKDKGIIDRMRSLPIARSAVLTGRTGADLCQTVLVVAVMIACGFIVGWRIRTPWYEALGAIGLLLLLGYAFTWIGALIGLSVRTPEAATSGGLIWLFPLTFLSNAFVPTNTLPGWLQAVADWNPLSATVAACRDLFGNNGTAPRPTPSAWSMQHPSITSLLWSLLILAVFVPLAVRKYRSATK